MMLLAWSYRLENEDDEMRRPPPKYSSCVRGVYSKENINYLPTYEEALKNIQLKKQHYCKFMPYFIVSFASRLAQISRSD
ncbi:unnamed protein product [Anisakis simplex]|uniref:Uncharacterized protein n=1 Tax=Anisakis simplex TaxID=6269 RepID=A0A3P6PWI1_ANISI|nr:unnamed protein product [Anisakis simplex]